MGPGIDFFSEFERAVTETTPKPKLMILGFPSNPTAQCVDLDFFEKLVALAKKHGVYIVHDLAYARHRLRRIQGAFHHAGPGR